MLVGGRIAEVGASVGVATITPRIRINELVHQADVAMYAASSNGEVQGYPAGLLRIDAKTTAVGLALHSCITGDVPDNETTEREGADKFDPNRVGEFTRGPLSAQSFLH